jgi:DNA-binding NtrC family response regulator
MAEVSESTQRAPARRAPHIRQFRVRVVGGPCDGAAQTSTGERLVIGTHRAAGLHVVDPTMSRFHCEIAIEGGRAIVRDLGSLNGTLVNGVSVIAAHLGERAILVLGGTQVVFELGREDELIELELHGSDRLGGLVGPSPVMRAAMALLARAAHCDLAVLICGELGTGKDLAAEAIHREGPRRDGPFVVVECAAAPADALARELMGDAERMGALAAAAGGTLVLDEVGELPLELQVVVLREVERAAPAVRVIATTSRDLRHEVNARNFRSDLLYRLAVLEISLPPLRHRLEDLPALVDELLRQRGLGPELPPPGTAGAAARLREPAALAELQRHAWPGNVRELASYVERALVFDELPGVSVPPAGAPEVAGGSAGAGTASPPRIDASRPLRVERERWLRRFEREYLELLLAAHGDNVSAAARTAGIDRIHLYRLLWRTGLRQQAPSSSKAR